MAGLRYGKGFVINLALDQDDYHKLLNTMAGIKNGADRVMRNAINRTLSSARTKMSRDIKKTVPKLKAGEIKKKIIFERASMSKLHGALRVSARRFTLTRFAYKQNKTGVPFMVYKSLGRLVARHAFFIRGKKPPFVRSGEGQAGYGRLIDVKKGTFRDEGKQMVGRLPISVVLGPEFADFYLNNRSMITSMNSFVNAEFKKNIKSYMNYEIQKATAMV